MIDRPQIQQDLKEAQLQGEARRVSVLRLLIAALQNKEIEKRTRLAAQGKTEKLDEISQLDPDEILAVISSEAKKRREAIEAFTRGQREERAAAEKKELGILEGYLPPQLEEAELRDLIHGAMAKTQAQGIKDLGKVMTDLAPQVRNRAPGEQVARLVKEELGRQGS